MQMTPELLLRAYRMGVFPMADDRGRVGWYLPDPRTILPLDGFHVSRSLAKVIRRGEFELRWNTAFAEVMQGCANREEGTWISQEFIDVFGQLHAEGWAHSMEAWKDGVLVGGVYGVAIGKAFMAESMFHRATNASKIALWGLIGLLNENRFQVLDVQYTTPHLLSLGATEISNAEYQERLARALAGDQGPS